MGVEQFTQAVSGQSGSAIETAPSGTIQTDNYGDLTVIETDGSQYPVSRNPAFVVQEVVVHRSADVELEIKTVNEVNETIPLHGSVLTLDTISIDEVVVRDPNDTLEPVTVVLIGE